MTLLAAVLVASAAATGAAAPRSLDDRAASVGYLLAQDAGVRRSTPVRATAWQGGTFTTTTGESVRVFVSPSYPDGAATGQRWAEFFSAMLHGPELTTVSAYVVTPSEMADICSEYSLGCYGGNTLYFMNETVQGVTPEEVARHEYGHHVAASRANPPWLAVDTGPKNWASVMNVCLRARQGTAFPGNEDRNYTLNPGEAFAETFRVLNELRAGATSFSWPLVDSSFYPNDAALNAAERDVATPWTAPVAQQVRARFTGKRKSWKTKVSTPLDGNLTVSLAFARGGLHDLEVLSADGKTVLWTGLWAGRAEKRVSTTVCGERSLVLRVTRHGVGGPFTVRVTHD